MRGTLLRGGSRRPARLPGRDRGGLGELEATRAGDPLRGSDGLARVSGPSTGDEGSCAGLSISSQPVSARAFLDGSSGPCSVHRWVCRRRTDRLSFCLRHSGEGLCTARRAQCAHRAGGNDAPCSTCGSSPRRCAALFGCAGYRGYAAARACRDEGQRVDAS